MTDIFARIRRSRKRRPARARRRRWPLVAAGAAGALLVTWAAWNALNAFIDAPGLRVRELRVVGVERLYEDDVRSMADDVIGRPVLRYDIGALRERIETVPGVESAVVARRLPDIVEIRVSECVAAARMVVRRRSALVDANGRIFPAARDLPGDDALPRILSVSSDLSAPRIAESDMPALRALDALADVTGRRPPAGTIIDLTTAGRLLMRPGPGAPALWLDRERPEMNLENLYVWKNDIARVAGGRVIDLRFPDRLTVVTGEDDGRAR